MAKALGYAKPRNAIATHCRGALKRGGVSVTTNQHGVSTEQNVEMSFIPESDLYRLVFRSNLPNAEKFTDWVTQEVLPAVRKTGRYQAKPMTTPEMLLAQAQVLVEQERRLAAVEANQTRVIEACSVPALGRDEWQDGMKKYLAGLCEEAGLSYPVMYGDLYGALERKMGCNLETRQKNLRRRMKQAGATAREQQSVSKLTVIARDPALASAFEGVVQRYAAHLAAKRWR